MDKQSLKWSWKHCDYIATDSEKYAKLTISKLVNNALRIESNLYIGRLVPELNDESIREIIQGNYRIIYQVVQVSYAYILTVHHSAMPLKNYLK
mgnify:CR=1 FL=1